MVPADAGERFRWSRPHHTLRDTRSVKTRAMDGGRERRRTRCTTHVASGIARHNGAAVGDGVDGVVAPDVFDAHLVAGADVPLREHGWIGTLEGGGARESSCAGAESE